MRFDVTQTLPGKASSLQTCCFMDLPMSPPSRWKNSHVPRPFLPQSNFSRLSFRWQRPHNLGFNWLLCNNSFCKYMKLPSEFFMSCDNMLCRRRHWDVCNSNSQRMWGKPDKIRGTGMRPLQSLKQRNKPESFHKKTRCTAGPFQKSNFNLVKGSNTSISSVRCGPLWT